MNQSVTVGTLFYRPKWPPIIVRFKIFKKPLRKTKAKKKFQYTGSLNSHVIVNHFDSYFLFLTKDFENI